jgi:lysophospholipid acyltransferase (LPLAT)-like uncharacterized protein
VRGAKAQESRSSEASLALVALFGAAFIRCLRATLRLRFHGEDEVRRKERDGEHFILAFWHRHMLLMPYAYRGKRMHVLSSHSRDGELMVRTLSHFGIGTVRGSSTRGGAIGLRGLLQVAAQGSDLGFTPDGPRGPAEDVKAGVLQASALSGLPIVPVAYAATRFGRLGSWDRMIVPLPFARLEYVFGEPMAVERGADLEAAGAELKRRLKELGREADRRAGWETKDA